VSGVVLDAGALIALERNNRTMWAAIKLAAAGGADVAVPSTALAQVWRGRRTQAALSLALQHCVTAPFDSVARQVGELCGKTRTVDICDAHVALVAATRGDALYTSDPDDMERLIGASGKRRPAIVRC
jgi:predicted nucleic acid-binding protein